MPLAGMVVLLLTFSSLTIQTIAIQGRMQSHAAQKSRLVEDHLFSAAQQLIGSLNASHRCLLPLPMQAWSSARAGCTDKVTQDNLKHNKVLDTAYILKYWQPSKAGDRVEFWLQEVSDGQEPAFRASFTVDLDGDPPLANNLRERGLRGVAP